MLLFDDANIDFEEIDCHEKTPSQERLLEIVFHRGMVPSSLPGFEGDIDV